MWWMSLGMEFSVTVERGDGGRRPTKQNFIQIKLHTPPRMPHLQVVDENVERDPEYCNGNYI